MKRHELTDEQWALVEPHLPVSNARTGRPASDRRTLLNAIFWILVTGAPWRDLPPAFGNWNSVFQRFRRWAKKGSWERIFQALVENPDFEYLIIDSTIVRAHQHAAGAKKGTLRRKPSGGARMASVPRSTSEPKVAVR